MLKPINVDAKIRTQLGEKIDKSLLKERKSGGQTLTYISANTCIDILNNIFGHNWSMRIIDHWMEPGYDQIIKEQLDWNTKQKKWPKGVNPPEDQIQIDSTGTRYIVVPQLPTAWCIVELEVNLVDDNGKEHKIVKQGFGSQAINGNQSVQSVNGYKGAQSDALKKAATLLGIALELYRDENESEVFNELYESINPIIWTDEVINQNKELWDKYTKIKEEYDWTDEDTAYFVEQVTDGYINNIYKMPIVYMNSLFRAIEKYMEGEDEE